MGPPKREVMAPTGRTMGEMIVFARVSEINRMIAPANAEAGIKKR